MTEAHLAGWESFYVIVGSSAAALTGLQFVVITLISEAARRSTNAAIAAFGTPTVVHFCIALLISSLLSAPWRRLPSAGAALGFTGLGGLAYTAIVIRRARGQKEYKPVFEDWLWHTVLPVLAYVAVVTAGIALPSATENALFLVAAATLVLVFIGIHNAWDTVVYVTFDARPSPGSPPT